MNSKVSAQHSPMKCEIPRAVDCEDTVSVLLTEQDKHHGGECDAVERVLSQAVRLGQNWTDRIVCRK